MTDPENTTDNRVTLRGEAVLQAKRVKSAEQMLARFRKMQRAGYMRGAAAEQKNDDLTYQQMRLHDLQKQPTTADADIALPQGAGSRYAR